MPDASLWSRLRRVAVESVLLTTGRMWRADRDLEIFLRDLARILSDGTGGILLIERGVLIPARRLCRDVSQGLRTPALCDTLSGSIGGFTRPASC